MEIICNYFYQSKILRAALIFGVPLIFTLYIYKYFRINYITNFSGELTLDNLKQTIIKDLDKKEQNLQSLYPLLEFGSRLFIYNLSIMNKMKIAVLASKPEYSEYESTLNIQSPDNSMIISYGQEKLIINGAEKDQIFDKIQQLSYSIAPPPGTVISYPNTIVKIQTNPNLGQIFFEISLNKSQLFLIYLVIWYFWSGILLSLKESKVFISQGFLNKRNL